MDARQIIVEMVQELVTRFGEQGTIALLESAAKFETFRQKYQAGGPEAVTTFTDMLVTLEVDESLPIFIQQVVPFWRELFVFGIAETLSTHAVSSETDISAIGEASATLRKLFSGGFAESLMTRAAKQQIPN